MLDDATKNAYQQLFQPGNLQVETETIDIGGGQEAVICEQSTTLMEVSLQQPIVNDKTVYVVLPKPIKGRKITVINSCLISEYNHYYLQLVELRDGVYTTVELPALHNPATPYVSLETDGDVWVATGRALSDSLSVTWNMVKAGQILWFGPPFGGIEQIYEENEYQVPYDCPYIIVTHNEETLSKNLALHLSEDFRIAGRLITVSVTLTGAAKHTLDVYTTPSSVYTDLGNGHHTARAIADTARKIAGWLIMAYSAAS